MPNTTTQAQPIAAALAGSALAASVDQARTAWATASRDTELDRWHALYDRAVPRPEPLTAMTTWERHEAAYPARDAGERARYAELDQSAGRHEADPEAGQ